MSYQGQERRKYQRINKKFIVTYKHADQVDAYDITQTKNVSLGGMLISTHLNFKPGTILALETNLPFINEKIVIYAKVIESKEIVKDLVYDTRLCFEELEERSKVSLEKAINFYLNPKG